MRDSSPPEAIFCEGLKCLARIRGDEKFYIVRTVYCKRCFFSVDFEADRRHIEEFELFGHSALKLARRLFARRGKLFGEGANLGFSRADERIELFDPLIRESYFIALFARGIEEREHFIFCRSVFYRETEKLIESRFNLLELGRVIGKIFNSRAKFSRAVLKLIADIAKSLCGGLDIFIESGGVLRIPGAVAYCAYDAEAVIGALEDIIRRSERCRDALAVLKKRLSLVELVALTGSISACSTRLSDNRAGQVAKLLRLIGFEGVALPDI